MEASKEVVCPRDLAEFKVWMASNALFSIDLPRGHFDGLREQYIAEGGENHSAHGIGCEGWRTATCLELGGYYLCDNRIGRCFDVMQTNGEVIRMILMTYDGEGMLDSKESWSGYWHGDSGEPWSKVVGPLPYDPTMPLKKPLRSLKDRFSELLAELDVTVKKLDDGSK